MKKLYRKRMEGLEEGLDALETAISRAVVVSESCIGIIHTGRQNRALFLFAKLIANNMSVVTLVQTAVLAGKNASLLDHFSVASLGRIAIDTAIMTLYISEPSLTLAQWNLRRHVLYLHDATSRKRFLDAAVRAEGVTSQYHLEGYSERKTELHSAIDMYGAELGLPQDKLERLKKGDVFVDGLRGAVREAGLNVDAWEHYNAYLSSFVHAHPVSFMRAEEHAISFEEPSKFQRELCGYVMEAIASCTEAVTTRVEAFCGDDAKDPLGMLD
ncbi:UNVERIFIED_ORG: hypothetical protein LHK14_01090 [Roseateles sp. XES5]|nr:hypothetical protein [Roseateles sp. XES5]